MLRRGVCCLWPALAAALALRRRSSGERSAQSASQASRRRWRAAASGLSLLACAECGADATRLAADFRCSRGSGGCGSGVGGRGSWYVKRALGADDELLEWPESDESEAAVGEVREANASDCRPGQKASACRRTSEERRSRNTADAEDADVEDGGGERGRGMRFKNE